MAKWRNAAARLNEPPVWHHLRASQRELSNRAVEFDSFVQGTLWQQGQQSTLHLADWTPMLASKGFASMIEDWIGVIEQGRVPDAVIERNIASHQLAEAICQKIG